MKKWCLLTLFSLLLPATLWGAGESYVKLGPKATRYISVEQVQSGIQPGSNLLRARFQGISTSSFKKEIKYRFIWFDASGFELSGITSNWQSKRISPKEDIRLQSIATNPAARSFQITIKEL